MKCPECQTDNREGRKFCGQCGAKLGWKCPNCGFDNEPDEKFCGGCGNKNEAVEATSIQQTAPTPKLEDMHSRLQNVIPQSLAEKYTAALQTDSRENRPVTALFADISGFTPLSTTLASEAVFQLVEECFNNLVNIVAEYEGKISGFRGDGLLALFGAPILHENDAERAILAALDMCHAMAEKKLQVSIGINTATMTVGEISTSLHSEYTAHSVEINLAARLQQTAQPEQILVGSGTYRLTRRAFNFQRIEGLSLRGIGEGIAAYEVLHVKEHPEKLRGIEGLRARMIGREREFAELREASDKLLAGEGQMVSIIGEAGIGKSRLVSELKAYMSELVEQRIDESTSSRFTFHVSRILEGRCVSIGNTISYLPVLDIFRSYFGLSEEDKEKEIATKVVENITRLFPQRADDILPFFGHLMSIKFRNELDEKLKYYSPEQIMHQTLMRLRDFFVTIAKEKPLLLILEDLHWADALSLELIMQLMDELVTTPLMLLCVYRPRQETEAEMRLRQLPVLAERKCLDRYTEINLKQLSARESRQLVETLLTIDNLPESVKEMILKRSEGNPFFIEEVIRSLIDRDLIYCEAERWKARREIIDLDVPETIQSVILARVDRLESEAKYVLQCASVIGRLFKYRLLEHLSRQERNLDQYLSDFEQRDLVYEERAIPELEYAFKHALTQETTYQGILGQRRQEFHHQVAQGIEALYRERIEEYYEELAYHYQKSPDKSKALEYLTKSGKKCFDAYAMQEAIRYYTNAIELAHQISVDNETVAELYQQRGEARRLIGEYEEQIEDYKEALEYTEKKDYRAMLCGEVARAYRWFRAERKNAIDYANLGRMELESADESRWAVEAYSGIGSIITDLDIDKGKDFFLKGIEIAQQIEYKKGLLGLYNLLIWAHGFRDENILEKVMELTSEVEDPDQRSASYFFIGIQHADCGNIPEAFEFFHKSIDLAERYGLGWVLPMCCGYLGGSYSEINEIDKALQVHEKGWIATVKIRHLFAAIYQNYGPLLHIYMQQGKFHKIAGMIEDYLDMMDKAMAKEENERDSPFVADRLLGRLNGAYRAIAPSAELRAQCQKRLEEGLERATNRMEVIFYLYQLTDFHLACENLGEAETYIFRLVEMNPRIGNLMLKPLLIIGEIETANDIAIEYLQENGYSARYLGQVIATYASAECFEALNQILEALIEQSSTDLIQILKQIELAMIQAQQHESFASILDISYKKVELKAPGFFLRSLQSAGESWNEFAYALRYAEMFYERMERQDEFRRICQQFKCEHPDVLQKFGLTQLCLEPAQPSIDYVKIENIDSFDGDSLSPVWEWVDPKGDCDYKQLFPSGLHITIPPGHDLKANYDAPRLLQNVSGDFAIETRILDGENGKKSGGLVVWKNEDNYIRFEMPSSSWWEDEVRFETNVKGNYIHPGRGLLDAETLVLRLERRGHRFAGYCSVDGENWLTCGWVDLPMDNPIQVGIHALCPQSPMTSTRFEYFKILRSGES